MATPQKIDPKSMTELMTAFDIYMKSRGAGDMYLKKRIGGVFDTLEKIAKTLEKNVKTIDFKKIADRMVDAGESITKSIQPMVKVFEDYSGKLKKSFDKLLAQLSMKGNLSDLFGIDLDVGDLNLSNLQNPKTKNNTTDKTDKSITRIHLTLKSIQKSLGTYVSVVAKTNTMITGLVASIGNNSASLQSILAEITKFTKSIGTTDPKKISTENSQKVQNQKMFSVGVSTLNTLKLISDQITGVSALFQKTFSEWALEEKTNQETQTVVETKKESSLKSFFTNLFSKRNRESGLAEKGIIIDGFSMSAKEVLKQMGVSRNAEEPRVVVRPRENAANNSPKKEEDESGVMSTVLKILGVGGVAALIAGIWKTGVFDEAWNKLMAAITKIETAVAKNLVETPVGTRFLAKSANIPFGQSIMSETGTLSATKMQERLRQDARTAKITDPLKKEKALNRDKFNKEIMQDITDSIVPLRKYRDLANKQARELDSAPWYQKIGHELNPFADDPSETFKKQESLINTLTDITYGKNSKLLQKIQEQRPDDFKDIVRTATLKYADELAALHDNRMNAEWNTMERVRRDSGINIPLEANLAEEKKKWEQWKSGLSDKIAKETKRLTEENVQVERWAYPKAHGSWDYIKPNIPTFKEPESKAKDLLKESVTEQQQKEKTDADKLTTMRSVQASELQIQAASMQLNAAQAQLASQGGRGETNVSNTTNVFGGSGSTSSHRERISNMRQFAGAIA